jgi:hypothetical protein
LKVVGLTVGLVERRGTWGRSLSKRLGEEGRANKSFRSKVVGKLGSEREEKVEKEGRDPGGGLAKLGRLKKKLSVLIDQEKRNDQNTETHAFMQILDQEGESDHVREDKSQNSKSSRGPPKKKEGDSP